MAMGGFFPMPVLFSILSILFFSSRATQIHECPPSSCGTIHNISYPFRLKNDPINCGDPIYELECENNRPTITINSKRFSVLSITYHNFTIRLVDPGIVNNHRSSCPHHYLTTNDLENYDTYDMYKSRRYLNKFLVSLSCSSPIDPPALYHKTALCDDFSVAAQQNYSYAFLGYSLSLEDVWDSCSVKRVTLVSSIAPRVEYSYGFELLWYRVYCKRCEASGDFCSPNMETGDVACRRYECSLEAPSTIRFSFTCMIQLLYDRYQSILIYTGEIIGGRFVIGMFFLVSLMVYKMRKRHLSVYETIENYLQGQNNLAPIRYSYGEIKKMTNNFKDKLGEGGYGTVFKGKLRSGTLAAVKIMGKTKASGEEFISEVSTIGRIHHVNVVNLIGFCFEGSKRALVYEFMPNGSLEKYIFPQEGEVKYSSWEKMFKISLGIARGMDYLHRGCQMQILHFDIKPHNILLDEDFNPKISDFGLAKLYPADGSIASLTAARGTMGYMAPELFYKNIGRVSYKADVYSFGMLLMEMAGKRKNSNPSVDQVSQIYFPSWVHDQFSQGKEIEMGDATEEERKIVKKMILVALWCIQMNPTDRPSMNKVVEMLEGDVELLEIPPKPFLSPEGMQEVHQDHEANANNVVLPLLAN